MREPHRDATQPAARAYSRASEGGYRVTPRLHHSPSQSRFTSAGADEAQHGLAHRFGATRSPRRAAPSKRASARATYQDE